MRAFWGLQVVHFLCFLQSVLVTPSEFFTTRQYVPAPLQFTRIRAVNAGCEGGSSVSRREFSAQTSFLPSTNRTWIGLTGGLCLVLRGSGREDDEDFIPATEFSGPRPGYVFKLCVKGLGYYNDVKGGRGEGVQGGNDSAMIDSDDAPRRVLRPRRRQATFNEDDTEEDREGSRKGGRGGSGRTRGGRRGRGGNQSGNVGGRAGIGEVSVDTEMREVEEGKKDRKQARAQERQVNKDAWEGEWENMLRAREGVGATMEGRPVDWNQVATGGDGEEREGALLKRRGPAREPSRGARRGAAGGGRRGRGPGRGLKGVGTSGDRVRKEGESGGRKAGGGVREGSESGEEEDEEEDEDEDEDEDDDDDDEAPRVLSREMLPARVRPPPQPSRESTLAEDLAVIKAAEKQLRIACDEGNVERATRLLRGGATFDEWDSCTEACATTLAAAQQTVWREEDGVALSEGSESGFAESEVERWLVELGIDPEEAKNPPHQDAFLDCQVTQQARAAMTGDKRFQRRMAKRAVQEAQAEHPKLACIQPLENELHFATFRSGDEDAVDSSEEDAEWADLDGFEEWEDPVGRRMDKIALAVKRNATEELESDEREKMEWLTCPCQELQDLMSSSVSEDGVATAPLLRIKKAATEITQGELNPWDKTADARLSESFGQKEFDVVDTLRGFERVSDAQGVRGSDQNYNQVRNRFLAAKTGSYKRPGSRPLTSRKL